MVSRRFGAADDGDDEHVVIAVSLGAVRQRFAVRRPAVPIRRSERRDECGRAAFDGQRVNARLAVRLRLVADDKSFAVGRNAVVVVATCGEVGVDDGGHAPVGLDTINFTTGVVDQGLAIREPIRRFDASWRRENDAAVGRIHRLRFERAVQSRFPRRLRWRYEFDVRKRGRFGCLFVVSTDAETNGNRTGERDSDGSTGKRQCLARFRGEEQNVHPSSHELNAIRVFQIGLHFVRRGTLGIAELERGQSIAVDRDIDVGRVGIERLADQKAGFAVRVFARLRKANGGR